MFVEQPLRMVGVSGAVWSFSAKPSDIELWAGAVGVPPVTDDGWTAGTGASWRSPVTPLPAGYDHCWDLPANGSISATMPVRKFAGGQVRVTGRVWNRSTGENAYSLGYFASWTVADGGLPLPGEGQMSIFSPAKAGTFSDLSAWSEFQWTIDVPARADTIRLEIEGDYQNQRTYLLDMKLEQVPEPGKTIEWGCLAAKDGHLDGLWSLPAMQGEILENVLYGGGLAPASPTWGPRPVTYHLALTGINRPAVMNELKRFTGFLASGPLTVYHHQYGICQNGFLAAPPTIEWLGYISNTVTVTFTLTFLDPRIWSILRNDPQEVVNWMIAHNTDPAVESAFYTWSGHVEPEPYEPGHDVLHTHIPVANIGATSTYPVIAWKANPAGDAPQFFIATVEDENAEHLGGVIFELNARVQGGLYIADMSTLKVSVENVGVVNDAFASIASLDGTWELPPGFRGNVRIDTMDYAADVAWVGVVNFQATM